MPKGCAGSERPAGYRRHVSARESDPLGYAVGAMFTVLAVVAFGVAVHNREPGDEPDAAPETPSSVATPSPAPASPAATPSATDLPVEWPPTVANQRYVDFLQEDKLPDGGELVDLGKNKGGLRLTRQGLTHGPVEGDDLGAGYLETELESDVHRVGARVVFPADGAGRIELAAWRTPIAEVDPGQRPVARPDSGMRLVVVPGHWELRVVDADPRVVAKGEYDSDERRQTFDVVRQGDTVYVIDPGGQVTPVEYDAAAGLAGPWASWGLVELGAGEQPAVIEAVWAG